MKSKAVSTPRSHARRAAAYISPRVGFIAQTFGLPFQEEEPVLFGNVMWTEYEWLVQERLRLRSDARLSLHTSNCSSKLEVLRPGYSFSRWAACIRTVVERACQSLSVPVVAHGAVTVARESAFCAYEPDDCFTLGREAEGDACEPNFATRPPDLAIFADRCLALLPKLPLCAALGFPEVWSYTNADVTIHTLTKSGAYRVRPFSRALPAVKAEDLSRFTGMLMGPDAAFLAAVEEWANGLKATPK